MLQLSQLKHVALATLLGTTALIGSAEYVFAQDVPYALVAPTAAAPDPAVIPPLLVQVGTAELLLSDSERLAAAAAEAGVNVTLHAGEGLPHVYQNQLGTPEADEASEQIGEFLRAQVTPINTGS